MPATGRSTSSSRTSVSTVPLWPPLRSRSLPRRRSRKRRPRRPRPSPSSSPSSSRVLSGRSVRGPRSFRDRPRSRPPSRLPPSAGVSAGESVAGSMVVATAGPFSPCSGRSAAVAAAPTTLPGPAGGGVAVVGRRGLGGNGRRDVRGRGLGHRAGGGNRLGRGAAGGFGGSARGTSRPGRRTATTRGGAGHRRVRRGGIRAQNVPCTGARCRAVTVRAGRRHDRQRRPRSGLARLPLADRRDKVALAHLRGVGDVQLAGKLPQVGQHHGAQAAPAGGCGGRAAGGVRSAVSGRTSGGDEIGLAHKGPS